MPRIFKETGRQNSLNIFRKMDALRFQFGFKKIILKYSFGAQRLNRIHVCSASRGKQTGNQSDYREQNR
jgi:hypothetical protein